MALRVLLSTSAFGYLLFTVDRRALGVAFGRLGAGAVLVAVGLVLAIVLLGTFRWMLLLRAYGATRLPSVARAFQLYLVGFFYNLYLPGAVGGDLVRGIASRKAFDGEGAGGATAGVTVVFVERVMGLAGLIALCAIASILRPTRVRGVGVAAAIGLLAAFAAILCVALARRFGARLPGALGRRAAALPALRSAPALVSVFLICVGLHFLLACTGHVLILAIEPGVGLADSAVIFPIGSATAFFPLTVGGAGVREATLVALFGAIGVGEASALAGSLALFGTQLFVAGFGGLWHLARPLERAEPGGPGVCGIPEEKLVRGSE